MNELPSIDQYPKVQGPDGEWYVTCQEVLTFLFAYLEDELPDQKQTDFEKHLGVCPSCVSYLKQYKDTVKLARESRSDVDSAPDELARDLVAAILASR